MANSKMLRRALPADYLRSEFDQLWAEGNFSDLKNAACARKVFTALVDLALFVMEGRRVGLYLPHAGGG